MEWVLLWSEGLHRSSELLATILTTYETYHILGTRRNQRRHAGIAIHITLPLKFPLWSPDGSQGVTV